MQGKQGKLQTLLARRGKGKKGGKGGKKEKPETRSSCLSPKRNVKDASLRGICEGRKKKKERGKSPDTRFELHEKKKIRKE